MNINRLFYWSILLLLALHATAPAQTPLPTWLHFGPVQVDVTKEYEHLQIYGLDRLGASLNEAQEADARRLAATAPTEGASDMLFGQPGRWELLRLTYPAKLASWAKTGGTPMLWANAFQTTISSAQREVTLTLDIIGGVRVLLNGEPIYKANWPGGRYDTRHRHDIPLALKAGANNVVVILYAIHLHTMNAFYAETSAPVEAHVRWRDAGGQRAALEADFARLYLTPWLGSSGDEKITAGVAGQPSRFRFSFALGNKLPPAHLAAGQRGPVTLAAARALPVGSVVIKTSAQLGEGEVINGPEFILQNSEAAPVLGRDWSYERRRQHVLETAAVGTVPARRALARAALGHKVTLAEIEPALARIRERRDTSDFHFHDLLRLYYQFPQLLDPAAAAAIKQAALNFKYWLDEPGASSMFMKSENHQILFHTLQYITGTLFPRETFVELGAPGTVQALKGRVLANEWIERRLRYGFDEWLAAGYLEKDVQAMLNVVDLGAEDDRLARSAQSVLDLIFLYLCSHEWQGYLHTTHGRSYIRQVTVPYTQDTAALVWLLTGKGGARVDSGVVNLALSRYRPPQEILRLTEAGAPATTRTQQGRAARGGGINTYTLRHPSYVLSTLVDSQAGARGAQAHVVQATLPGHLPVFINSAVSSSELSRPGYWMGNWELPRAFQVNDLAIVIYRLRDPLAFTHCYFPLPQFDRWAEKGGWIAGEKDGGYVAVYSQSGVRATETGLFRHFEILSTARNNIWLVKTGSRQDYATLEKFLDALPAPSFSDDGVTVAGLRAGWTGPLTANGKPVATTYQLIENDWVSAPYGEGVIRVQRADGGQLFIGR